MEKSALEPKGCQLAVIEYSNATYAKYHVSRQCIASFRFIATSSIWYSKSGLYLYFAWPESDTLVFWFVDRLECLVSLSLTRVRWHISPCIACHRHHIFSEAFSYYHGVFTNTHTQIASRSVYRHPDMSIQQGSMLRSLRYGNHHHTDSIDAWETWDKLRLILCGSL